MEKKSWKRWKNLAWPRHVLALCSWLSFTRMGLPHAPSGSRPRLGTCPVTVRRSRGESAVTFPRSRLAVTVPRYRTSPGSRPHFILTPPGHVPLPIANPNPCTRCTVLTGERCSWEPHGSKLKALSWSCVARWHATAFYSKRRAGQSSLAACFIAGWSCGRRMNRFSCSLSHVVDSLALLRTGCGAVGGIRCAVEVPITGRWEKIQMLMHVNTAVIFSESGSSSIFLLPKSSILSSILGQFLAVTPNSEETLPLGVNDQ